MPPKMIEDENRPYCHDCDRWMKRERGLAESGRQRYTCHGCKVSTTGSGESMHSEAYPGYDAEAAGDRARAIRDAVANGANRFVITCAVNNTEVHYPAWKALRALCDDRQAHLIVIPVHYKNISLYTANQEYLKWWPKAVKPYLVDEEIRIGPKTWVNGDIKVQATAATPLTGMAPIAGDRWVIFGHPQMALEPIATPMDQIPGRMMTTGAITQKSYSRTKTGAKAAFHHTTGALLVEISGDKTFVRQLNVDSKGRIFDLTDCYLPSGEIRRDRRALSLTTGDEHVKWMLPNVRRATYTDSDSIAAVVQPEYLVRHDVLDGYAGSHHHLNDYRTQYRKFVHGDADYKMELDQVVDHINLTTPPDCTNVIVQDSNHHDHLQSWLQRADDRTDHLNADLICELRGLQREAIRKGEPDNAFELYVAPRLEVPAKFIPPSAPFMLGGVDFSQHGQRGANGARGSANAFANTTHKLVIGHTHSARIVKSVFQVGKSCGVLEYESGLSSHTNTHCIQYQNGKRTLVDIFGISWRARSDPSDGGLSVSPDSPPDSSVGSSADFPVDSSADSSVRTSADFPADSSADAGAE